MKKVTVVCVVAYIESYKFNKESVQKLYRNQEHCQCPYTKRKQQNKTKEIKTLLRYSTGNFKQTISKCCLFERSSKKYYASILFY